MNVGRCRGEGLRPSKTALQRNVQFAMSSPFSLYVAIFQLYVKLPARSSLGLDSQGTIMGSFRR